VIVGRAHTDRHGRVRGDADGAHPGRTRIYAKSAHLVAADHDRADVAEAVTAFVSSLARQPVEP
jgi:hypothetical protein